MLSICGRIFFLSVAVRSDNSHTQFAIAVAFVSLVLLPTTFFIFVVLYHPISDFGIVSVDIFPSTL
jgi:hypothetical protein